MAHTGYPTEGLVHFDGSEPWAVGNSPKIIDNGRNADESVNPGVVDLRYVALHELGRGHNSGILLKNDMIFYYIIA